jgi:hypothetical protein
VALPLDVQRTQQADSPRTRRPRRAVAVVLGCYLLLAFGLTWQLWADPAIRVPTAGHGVSADIFLSAWFIRYAAVALTHGHLPALVTSALNAPHGVSVMWNTSILLPAVLLAPLTLLAGPLTSLTVMITLGFAGSAATMFAVLRRWGAGLLPAAIGGAVFGFSPALRQAAEDHYHLQFAVLIPLIIDAAVRLFTGRGSPVRTGIWLGLLMSAQIFIAEELLVDAVLAGLIMAIVLVASRPRSVLTRIRPAAAGLGIAVAVLLVLCGYALYIQLRGPLAESGSPWDLAAYGNQPVSFVTAPPAMLLHTGSLAGFMHFLASNKQRLVEYFSYLGWPLLVAVLAATAAWWRDLRIRVAGVTFIVLELCSMGGTDVRLAGWRLPANALPWHWLQGLPLLSQALPNRLSILADAAAAVVLAFGLERAWAAARARPRWGRPAVAAAATLALLPVIPLSLTAVAVASTPPGWTAVLDSMHLKRGATVLELPLIGPQTMMWQALTGADISIAGGYCITRGPGGKAAACDTANTLTADQHNTLLELRFVGGAVPGRTPPTAATLLGALGTWRPAAIITTSGPGAPLNRYLAGILGPPSEQQGQVLGWRLRWLSR